MAGIVIVRLIIKTCFNLIQNTMNTAIVRDPNYQHMHCSDKVLNLFRVGLVLNTEGAQGDFNSLFFNLYFFIVKLLQIYRIAFINV